MKSFLPSCCLRYPDDSQSCPFCLAENSWSNSSAVVGSLSASVLGTTSDIPKYEYVSSPWNIPTVFQGNDSIQTVGLDGQYSTPVVGFNFAKSQWLACEFTSMTYNESDKGLAAAIFIKSDSMVELTPASNSIKSNASSCPPEGSCIFMDERIGFSSTRVYCDYPGISSPAVVSMKLMNAPTRYGCWLA